MNGDDKAAWLTELDKEFTESSILEWWKSDDASEIVVVVRYFLLLH